jgi:hypothetical protein
VITQTAMHVAWLTLGDAVMAVFVAAFLTVPGLMPAWVLVRRVRGGDWPTVLVAAAAIDIAAIALVSTVGHYAGIGLGWTMVLYLAVVIGAAFGSWRMRGESLEWASSKQGLFLGGVVALAATAEGTLLWYTGDIFFHMGAARSLLAGNQPLVTDALYGTATRALDPVSGSWPTMVAIWARATGIDVTALVPALGIVLATMMALAVWTLLRRVSSSATAATVATVAWVVISQYADFRIAVIPNQASLAFVFLAFAMLVELAEAPGSPAAILTAASGLAAASMHLISAQVLLVGAGFMVVFVFAQYVVDRVRHRPASLASTGAMAASSAAILALAAPLILPRAQVAGGTMASTVAEFAYYNDSLLKLPGGLVVVADTNALTNYSFAVVALGSLLGILMLLAALRDDDSRVMAAAALALLPVLLLFDPPVTTLMFRFSTYMAARMGAVLRFAPIIALAWGLGKASRWSVRRVTAYLLLIALFVFGAAQTSGTFSGRWVRRLGMRFPVAATRKNDIRVGWGQDTIEKLRAIAGSAYPRAAGAPDTAYYLAGAAPFSVVAVGHSHNPWSLEGSSGQSRRDDMVLLLDPATGVEGRRAILSRWDASFVILDLSVPAQRAAYTAMLAEPSLLKPVLSTPRVVLFRVVR